MLYAQVKAKSLGCKEEGYKNAHFQEHFIYTGSSVSPYTKEVSVIGIAPLAYYEPYKSTRRVSGVTQTTKTKGERKRMKRESIITVVTDTIQEKNFRVAHFLLDVGYPTKVIKVPCGIFDNSFLHREIAESLTALKYYAGDLDAPMSGELWNALMKFQADHSLLIGPISQKTVDALRISLEEINELIDRENELIAIDEHKRKFIAQTTPLQSHSIEPEMNRADFKRLYAHCIEEEISRESTSDTIYLMNPSFEDIPHGGGLFQYDTGITGWFDCGMIHFKAESPPDIQPTPDNTWGVSIEAAHGCTYLGLVVRDNDTWESVSQKLQYPLEATECYSFSVQLAQSEQYISATRLTGELANYNSPTRIQIWGGDDPCQFQELLAESTAESVFDWQSLEFVLSPSESTKTLSIRAFTEDATSLPSNGHILVDDLSPIVKISCN